MNYISRNTSRFVKENMTTIDSFSIEQWLQSFIDAEFIVTSSFHGCISSIIFNKPFIVIGNVERGVACVTSSKGGGQKLLSEFYCQTAAGFRSKLEFDICNVSYRFRHCEKSN